MSPVRKGQIRIPVISVAALPLCAATIVVSGCGETVIDSTKAEDTLQASLERSLDEKIKTVDCPTDQEVEPGATFSCDVVFSDGTRELATLKIRNEDADVSLVGLKTTKVERGE